MRQVLLGEGSSAPERRRVDIAMGMVDDVDSGRSPSFVRFVAMPVSSDDALLEPARRIGARGMGCSQAVR